MCADNPMSSPAAIERHYRETEDMPFDDYYVRCYRCQKDVEPLEMDIELDDVCNNCVDEVMKKARAILKEHLYHADLDLYDRIIAKYTEGVL